MLSRVDFFLVCGVTVVAQPKYRVKVRYGLQNVANVAVLKKIKQKVFKGVVSVAKTLKKFQVLRNPQIVAEVSSVTKFAVPS